MNWTYVVYGRPMLLVFAWFIIDVHKWFKGPRVDVEYNILGDGDDGLEVHLNGSVWNQM